VVAPSDEPSRWHVGELARHRRERGVATGKLTVVQLLRGHRARINHVGVSQRPLPHSTGGACFTASDDSTVRVYRWETVALVHAG
jgi:hypothetical protein